MPNPDLDREPITLADHLAMDRTVLANERTLLAYGRTSLALLAVGASAMRFFDSVAMEILGVSLIAIGLVTAGIGSWRYRRMARLLQRTVGDRFPYDAGSA